MNATSAFQRIAASVAELLVAVGVYKAVLFVSYRVGCQFTACHDVMGIGVLLYALPFAGLVAIAYWIAALLMGERWRRRLLLDGVAAVVAAAGFLLASR